MGDLCSRRRILLVDNGNLSRMDTAGAQEAELPRTPYHDAKGIPIVEGRHACEKAKRHGGLAARAAKIICCFGMSSVCSVGSMPHSDARVFPPIFMAESLPVERGNVMHLKKCRRRLNHRDETRVAHR